ncbi:MAG: hypothetical protein O2880_07760, partial [Proteobacteria bacterium]|nr:hypothetical protein [Pseudomonadota bacterium]
TTQPGRRLISSAYTRFDHSSHLVALSKAKWACFDRESGAIAPTFVALNLIFQTQFIRSIEPVTHCAWQAVNLSK